jgi:hypothetical protein
MNITISVINIPSVYISWEPLKKFWGNTPWIRLLFSWSWHSLFRLNHEDKSGILFRKINIHLQEYMTSTNAGDSPPRKPEILSYVAKIYRRYKHIVQEVKRNRRGGENDMPGRQFGPSFSWIDAEHCSLVCVQTACSLNSRYDVNNKLHI